MSHVCRRHVIATCAMFFLFSCIHSANAEDFGTAEQAKAMVDRVTVFFKANGKEKTLAELSNPKGQFIDRDLYVIAYSLEGIRLAHPYNPKLIGLSVLDAVDFDGKAYGKDIITLANGAGSGWVDYKFTDPTTKKLADKSLYILKAGDLIFGCGIYKR
ncbi:cache domain-containing protein [Telmatospirillum sp.]|uniref:cache domain-containing protein n=1 Tax=Telmatospirillum sp. TaxID=2079197 RepID=UPI00283AF8AD|nr:cache domain-containing protein [Telmatospirillum sp.]MDR3437174.1 cache domain-containing protein [Telmatospirillum sp.]